MIYMHHCLALLLTGLFILAPAFSVAAQNAVMSPNETVQIIVTTDTITIGTNFTGTDLYIAGVVEHADPMIYRQNGYNVVVTLEGPKREIIMREKKRHLGVWVNADALSFVDVPAFYSLAATRELRDITSIQTYRELGLGVDYLPLRTKGSDTEKADTFRKELVRLRRADHLYSEHVGTVSFGGTSLFRARFQLPANLPVGNYHIDAYLFREGAYISHASTRIDIMKAHLAYSIFRAAHRHSFWYGIAAVIIAVLTGFAGRLIFCRD